MKDSYNPMLLNKFHAYRRSLESLGLYDPELTEHTRPLPEAAGNALRLLLARTMPDAIFVAGDHQVPYIEKVLKGKGMRLPVVRLRRPLFRGLADRGAAAPRRRRSGRADAGHPAARRHHARADGSALPLCLLSARSASAMRGGYGSISLWAKTRTLLRLALSMPEPTLIRITTRPSSIR